MPPYDLPLWRLREIEATPDRHGSPALKYEAIAMINEIETGLAAAQAFGLHEDEHLRLARGFAQVGSIRPALVEVMRALRLNRGVHSLLTSG